MQSTLGEFQETRSEQPFALQNSKLLKVSLDQITIQAKAGSMVAYQGQVAFEHAGSGGMSRMLKKAVSGEGTTLMKMSGTGEVFLADTAQEIHLLYLENDAITVNEEPAGLRRRDRLGHQEGGGSQRHGGRRAVQHLSAGQRLGGDRLGWPARAAQHREAPTFADPQAAITWASSLQTSIKTDIKLKNFIGRGSGESIQMAFSGQGWVLVQPSEGRVLAPSGGGSSRGGLLSNLGG